MTFALYPQLKWQRPESSALSLTEGKVNCGGAGGAAMANWYLHDGEPRITHHAFRLQAGNPGGSGSPTGLGTSMVQSALQIYGVDSDRYSVGDLSIAKQALKDGHALGIAIHYPYINANYPKLSGQLTFKGEHFLCLFGWYEFAPHTNAHDPLFDGRCRTWGCAPLGPQRAPWKAYAGAMAQFRIVVNGTKTTVEKAYGPGKGVFIVVRKPGV
jgi:hypothetical protein